MKVCCFRKFKAKHFRGPFSILIFFSHGGGWTGLCCSDKAPNWLWWKQTLMPFWMGMFFYFIKMNIKDRTTGYVSITSAVIHFENGHHGPSGHLVIRTMSPKLKTMSPYFILGRNIRQAGKCSKGSLFRDWINWTKINGETQKFRKFQKKRLFF